MQTASKIFLASVFALLPYPTSRAAEPWRPNSNLEVVVDVQQGSRIRRYTSTTDMIDATITNRLGRTIEVRVLCGDSVVSDREVHWRMAPYESREKPFQILSGFRLEFKGVLWRFPDS